MDFLGRGQASAFCSVALMVSLTVLSFTQMPAAEPRGEGSSPITDEERQFWSFQAVKNPPVPVVKNNNWPRSPIDRFIVAGLEAKGLRPVKAASRRDLIRRATYDLIGLPPTPQDVESFVADPSPDAFAKVVDRLLASPHYGERWSRHWLDVVRYGDDQLRAEYYYRALPHAWRYRDWVVRALNVDLPYDQFVVQQIAGDLLKDSVGHDGVISVGFLALGLIYQSDGGTPDGIAVAQAETLDDRVDTVTRGFLGLTVSCARCHDHKFDPIPIADYYSLAGVFKNTKYVEDVPLVPKEAAERYHRAQQAIAELKKQLQAARKAKDKQKATNLRAEISRLQQAARENYAGAHSVVDAGDEDMRIAKRGNLLNPGAMAPRRFLRILAGDDPPRFRRGSGRLELARAIASPNNPLTARVMVNRIWQHHFGRGIVATASNFGALGELPTHPQLLDWLAHRFVESGWSIKQLHRGIMLSAGYQLSNAYNQSNSRIDSDNKWLWHMNRRRLDVEAWRDGLLAVSGRLDRRIGGPPDADLLSGRRRTLYAAIHRDSKGAADEFLRLFDFPNPRIGSSGRVVTTVPQQQLFVLNGEFMIDQARALSARLAADFSETDARIRRAFALLFGRDPVPAELRLAHRFLRGPVDAKETTPLSLWEQYCQALLSSNEFLYRP